MLYLELLINVIPSASTRQLAYEYDTHSATHLIETSVNVFMKKKNTSELDRDQSEI